MVFIRFLKGDWRYLDNNGHEHKSLMPFLLLNRPWEACGDELRLPLKQRVQSCLGQRYKRGVVAEPRDQRDPRGVAASGVLRGVGFAGT